MFNQNLLKTSVFCIFSMLFFSNCRTYSPATTGNGPVYISYPWYEGKPISSVGVGARGNTGTAYISSDKNLFGEANVHYSHVFEMGHASVNVGGYTGRYQAPAEKTRLMPYHGLNVGGEVGLHIPTFIQMMGMGGMIGSGTDVETTAGLGYEFKSEKGKYFDFREALPDSSFLGRTATKLNVNSSPNLHKIYFFRELRQKINANNIHGIRSDLAISYEGNFQTTGWNSHFTYHFTHKTTTFYGQAGFAFSSGHNPFKPLFGLGINQTVWRK